jgi:histone deacetylase 6
VHPKAHIQKVRSTCENLPSKKNSRHFTQDTYENKYSYSSALMSAGGAIEGVRSVLQDSVTSSFCIIRPPGHHASCTDV